MMLKKRRILAAKIETTEGTPESLAAGDAVFNVYDMVITPDIPMTERRGQGNLSKLPSVPGARGGKITFSIDLHGSGNSGSPIPAWASTFLPACDMLATGNIYSFASAHSDGKCLTMGAYEDGVFKSLAGAKGTFSLDGENGKPVKINFEFTGVWQPPTDVALITPTYPTIIPPRFASATLTLGSYAPIISMLKIAANNVVKLRQTVNNVAAYLAAAITDRNANGSLDPESTSVAAHDAHGLWIAGTTAALSCVVGTVAGNTVTLAAPALQRTNVQPGDRDGLQIDTIDFELKRSVSLGDDELTITFG